MHNPVRIEVIWDDPDIELRLMKALADLTASAIGQGPGSQIDPLALKRVGDWYARRCAERVVSVDV